MAKFRDLWDNHPGRLSKPCDEKLFQNQCAIRMSVALHKSKVDLSSFRGARCWASHEDKFKHILRAQELANWLKNSGKFGRANIYVRKGDLKISSSTFFGKKGIIFIKNGWYGGVDHIDVWDGIDMKGGSASYLDFGEEVWFWELY
jgi:hypothetical protein